MGLFFALLAALSFERRHISLPMRGCQILHIGTVICFVASVPCQRALNFGWHTIASDIVWITVCGRTCRSSMGEYNFARHANPVVLVLQCVAGSFTFFSPLPEPTGLIPPWRISEVLTLKAKSCSI
jgi:hypothetical protein